MCCGQSEHHGHRPMHHADECGCGHGEHHGHGPGRGFAGCGCGEGSPHQFGPVFLSKKKQIRMLEHLLEQKRAEVQDLTDLLDELKQAK